jgi:hypothetical protein
MTTGWPWTGDLLAGPLCGTSAWPCTLHVRLCDLRPRFLVKRTIGAGRRAVARNGRVLLCSDRPLDELPGRPARLRVQTWHRAILPGDTPGPYGILLCVRCQAVDDVREPLFTMQLVPRPEARGDLRVEVGGGLMLDFCSDN